MSLETYSDLCEAIAGWLNRSDLTARVPDFIRLAEAQMNRQLDCRQMVQTMPISISGEDYWLPNDFAGVKSLRLDGTPSTAPEYVLPEALDDAFAAPGRPCRYTITDRIVFDPVPDGVYAGRLRYRKRLCPLSATNRCNWLLKQHPDAYLYGALVQAAPYLEDDDRVGVWGGFFNAAIDQINADDKRQAFPGTVNARGRPL